MVEIIDSYSVYLPAPSTMSDPIAALFWLIVIGVTVRAVRRNSQEK